MDNNLTSSKGRTGLAEYEADLDTFADQGVRQSDSEMQDEEESREERSRLFIVGQNIEYDKARYQHARGRLDKVAVGVYVDSDVARHERERLVQKNAVRIAHKLLPAAVLAGSSAYHRGTVEGALFISTPRGGHPVDVGGGMLTIYQTKSDLDVGLNREVQHVTIRDSYGELPVKRLADEMLILKNFMPRRGNRPRSTYLNNIDLNRVAERAMREIGSREKFVRRLTSLAKSHGLMQMMPKVEAFIENVDTYEQEQTMLEAYRVFWHQMPVATLGHDGHAWNFEYEPSVKLQLSINERRGKGAAPSFLASLLPEVGLRTSEGLDDRLHDLRGGHRYISNITVQPGDAIGHRDIINDVLEGELTGHRDHHLQFTGKVGADLRGAAIDSDILSTLHQDPSNPRMSGMQAKLAANLDLNGNLTSARGRAFTHIVKIVGSDERYSSTCSMEWFSLVLAKAVGMDVEEFAIVDLGAKGPALVVERFDIRRDVNDKRLILTEDFWSIEGLTVNKHKYQGELVRVADRIRRHSTNLAEDSRALINQAVFNWLTWNGDFHLKNMMLLKVASSPKLGFDSIRLAPVYDVMCTQVFPNDPKSAAVYLDGSREHTLSGFRVLGRRFGIKSDEVDTMVSYMAHNLILWSRRIAENLAPAIRDHKASVDKVERAVKLIELRCTGMLLELDESSKRQQRRRKTGEAPATDDLAEEVESFSADFDATAPAPLELRLGDAEAEEHVSADKRRSWAPEVAHEAPAAAQSAAGASAKSRAQAAGVRRAKP